MRSVARGPGNQRIAGEPHLSQTTIKRHLPDAYEKLGVRSRGEAVGKAVSGGRISSQDISRTTD